MDKATLARTGIAGAVAGLGLAVGGVALATADSPETPEVTQAFPDVRPGPHLHLSPGGGRAAEVLAEELGLDEDVVEEALRAVHDELRPDAPDFTERMRPPTEEDRAERESAFAAALAKELGVSEAKVEAALAVLRAELDEQLNEHMDEMRADMRERLVERLDAAVEDGTLTESDKASVLKAYDAGVIGGPFGGMMGGMMGFGPHGSGFTDSAFAGT